MKKVFVTGASGYIGSVVVKRLIEMNYQITVFDNLERGHRMNVPIGATLIQGDLRDASAVQEAMMSIRPDAVMHFAAYALVGESMTDPMKYFSNNVKGGINLLEAMESVGCKRIVFSSTCATYGIPSELPIEENMPQIPTNPYGQSKLMFEQMLDWMSNLKGFNVTSLRYFNAAGAIDELGEDHEPETHLIPNVLKVALDKSGSVMVFGTDYPTKDGTCVRDYIHIEDLASAHILALEKNALGAYNLGTGKGVSVKEVIETCRAVTGHPIPVKYLPRRAGDPPSLFASGKKAREVMGWNPSYSDIKTIVSDAWNFHKSHPNGLEKK